MVLLSLLVKSLPHLFLVLQGGLVNAILILKGVHFYLHVLDAEVLQLNDFFQLDWQVWVLLIYAEGGTLFAGAGIAAALVTVVFSLGCLTHVHAQISHFASVSVVLLLIGVRLG